MVITELKKKKRGNQPNFWFNVAELTCALITVSVLPNKTSLVF